MERVSSLEDEEEVLLDDDNDEEDKKEDDEVEVVEVLFMKELLTWLELELELETCDELTEDESVVDVVAVLGL